jgi:short-subunit dehydrogenase/acyl carrier protein
MIDLDPTAANQAAVVLDEIDRGDGEDEIAYRGGGRLVARLVRSNRPTQSPVTLRSDATYLITGGAGGLGVIVADWMASHGARHLVLVGRKGKASTKAGEHAIERLTRRGVEVRLVAADVTDRDRMSALVEELKSGGAPLRGIVHAAGVLRNDDVKSVEVETIREVFRPKVKGAWILHDLTKALPLDLFVMFSSGASIWGSRGLVHYAAANQFLDSLAHYRRSLGLSATSINWGPWAEAGMASAEGQRVMEQMGVSAFTSAEGSEALSHVLSTGAAQVVAAKVDWRVFAPIYRAKARRHLLDELAPDVSAGAAQRGPGAGELAARVAAALPGDRREVMLAALQDHAAAVLGLEDTRPDTRHGLTELGMDSLMAVELRNRLQHALGAQLAPTLAFDCPTLEAMATHLIEVLGLNHIPAPRPAAAPVAADVAEVGVLSEEEVRTLLAGELAALSLDGIGEDKKA